MWLRIILLLLLLNTMTIINSVYANGRNGIDVVIMIDQSGSMSGRLLGSKSHPQPNDEYGHRVAITKNVVNRLAEHVEGTPFVHQVSVIEFGTQASVFISNMALSYDPNSPGAALRMAQQRISLLKPAKLDYTNTPAAIEKALAEFDKMDKVSGVLTREKFLLLITDGRPSLPPHSTGDLRKQTKIHSTTLTQNGANIWVVGLNDADNYWNEYDGPKFWEPIAGYDTQNTPRARLAEPAFPHIATVARYIVDEWLKVSGEENFGEEAFCPPYLRRIVFDAHFNKPGASLRIMNPNGRTIQPSSASDTYARYVIDDPYPGNYQLQKTPGFSYKIYVEKYPPTLVFLSPKPTANQNIETRIIFQLMKSYTTLDIIPDLPIEAKIHIKPPSGQTQILDAQFNGEGKFVVTWTPIEEGKHELSFQAIVHYQDGSQTDLWDNTQQVIEIIEVLPHSPPIPPLWLRLEKPNPQNNLWMLPWSSEMVTIKVALQEGNQEESRITDIENYIIGSDDWLSLQLVDKSGVPLPPLTQLKKDSENYFVANIPLTLDWAQGEGWWYPGELNLEFIASSDRVHEDRTLNGVWLPIDLADKRVNGDSMTVGAIKIKIPWWLYLIMIGLLIVLLIGVFILFQLFVLPKRWLEQTDTGRKVDLLIYDSMEGPDGFGALQPISIARQLKMQLDNQVKIMTKDGNSLIAQQFRLKREPSIEPPCVTINYRWQNDKEKYQAMVRGKNPQQLKGMLKENYMVQLSYTKTRAIDVQKNN